MAAIFALVFVPALAAVGFMTMSALQGDLSFGSALATVCFALLAMGVFYGLLSMARQWDAEPAKSRS
jgi:hypothetical protein